MFVTMKMGRKSIFSAILLILIGLIIGGGDIPPTIANTY